MGHPLGTFHVQSAIFNADHRIAWLVVPSGDGHPHTERGRSNGHLRVRHEVSHWLWQISAYVVSKHGRIDEEETIPG